MLKQFFQKPLGLLKSKGGGGGSHMRPCMDFHLVLHGEYL